MSKEDYGHVWQVYQPTDKYEFADCDTHEAFDVVNCGDDVAKDILTHLLPNVAGSTVTEI